MHFTDPETMQQGRSVARQIERLKALEYGNDGVIEMIISKPAPGVHLLIQEATLVPGIGLKGDHARKSWYKGAVVPGREVSAVSLEVLHLLDVDPSVVGDNLVTRGIDLRGLAAGTQFRVGEAILERSNVPHRPCLLFKERTNPTAFKVAAQGYRGALFIVKRGGIVKTGDAIQIENE